MADRFLKLYVWLRTLQDESGQDLIEYALVVSLIAFAAVAGMNSLATQINAAFNAIGSTLATTA
jgi:pilus assembly protein Flp/PilA